MTKRSQFIVMLACPPLAAGISLLVHANTLVSTVLFLGIPSALLSWWSPRNVKKALLFTLAFLPVWFVADVIIYLGNQWYVVSAFSYRVLGLIALEELPWVMLVQYGVVMFWEHFFERKRRERPWRRRMTYLTSIFVSIFIITMVIWQWSSSALTIPYFYFVMMAGLFFIPTILELLRHPNLGTKFFRVSLYFTYTYVLYELTALTLGQWLFTGQYIGWVTLLGLRFPFEEFVAWILVGAAACLSWYEHFNDDER